MGHTNVDTTLNVYTQVLDGSLRAAVDKVGGSSLRRGPFRDCSAAADGSRKNAVR